MATITTSALADQTAYTLTVRDVADRAAEPNAMQPTRVEFTFRETAAVDRDGLQVLYTFDDGAGDTIRDLSGGEALTLKASDAAAVEWTAGALVVRQPTLIVSEGPAAELIEACRAANALTIEAWVKPAALDQMGPARIVSVSKDTGSRNFTLGQTDTTYIVRLRTTTTSENGIPELVTPERTLKTDLTHVVYVREPLGVARIYVDGAEQIVGATRGDLSNWDPGFHLALANEMTRDRAWLGEYHLVAMYSRALSGAEVTEHYLAGPDVEVEERE